jgi:RES domain-containing protein
MTAWRIVQARHLATAFSGEGAREYPGRWNERGTPVVYAAGSLSLAAMEMLVHLGNADLLGRYMSISVAFEERLCKQLDRASLPADWSSYPAPASTRAIGARWLGEASSLLLAVPSAIIPIETIFLINPRHPDFQKIDIGTASTFSFDPRLAVPRK